MYMCSHVYASARVCVYICVYVCCVHRVCTHANASAIDQATNERTAVGPESA